MVHSVIYDHHYGQRVGTSRGTDGPLLGIWGYPQVDESTGIPESLSFMVTSMRSRLSVVYCSSERSYTPGLEYSVGREYGWLVKLGPCQRQEQA